MVASRANPGLYWTHNDSGDGPFVYAFDRQGKSRGVWRVTGASAHDWEDIAAGPGPDPRRTYLYVGDIGDNEAKRSAIDIYRFVEPAISAADARSSKSNARSTATADVIHLRYSDGKHDAETLLVHPRSGDVYVITKSLLGRAGIYKASAPLDTTRTITMVKVGVLNLPSLLGGYVTGGDISPDGRRVAICDYTQAEERGRGERAGKRKRQRERAGMHPRRGRRRDRIVPNGTHRQVRSADAPFPIQRLVVHVPRDAMHTGGR